jgi:hypothetical protein
MSKRNNIHPIIESVTKGDTLETEYYLSSGADINQLNQDGKSLIEIALEQNDYLMAQFLLSEGADITNLGHIPNLYTTTSCIKTYKKFCTTVNSQILNNCSKLIKIKKCDKKSCDVFSGFPADLYPNVYVMQLVDIPHNIRSQQRAGLKGHKVVSSLLFYFMNTDEGIISGFHANTEKGFERRGYISMLIGLFVMAWPLGVGRVGCNSENPTITRIIKKLNFTPTYYNIPPINYSTTNRIDSLQSAYNLVSDSIIRTCNASTPNIILDPINSNELDIIPERDDV